MSMVLELIHSPQADDSLNIPALARQCEMRSRNGARQIELRQALLDVAGRIEKNGEYLAAARPDDEAAEGVACNLAYLAGVLRSMVGGVGEKIQ